MAIVQEKVTIDGVELKRYRSDQDVKIRCIEDGNIYPLAYLTPDATVTFAETGYPLNDISAGAIVSCDNVLGLSDYVIQTIDELDGIKDDHLSVDLGGADGPP